LAERTIPWLFERSVQQHADRPYLWEKRDGQYRPTTYREVRDMVYETAAGLMALGVQKGDRIALLSEGRVDWVVAELGILYAGAIDVPLSVKLNEREELKFRLSHAECRFAFVSGQQAPKVLDLKKDLPDLEKVILMDGEPQDEDEITLRKVRELGKEYLREHEAEFRQRWQSVREDDIANICYTSGTTADPKGIMLTHRNYTANVEQCCAMMEIPPDWVTLLILPWDHSFGHTAGIYTFMAKGASIAAVEVGQTPLETLRNIPKNIQEVRPHMLYSVPSLSQNFRKGIERAIRQKGPRAEKLFRKALNVAYDYNGLGIDRGKGLKRKLLKPMMQFYDKILFSKIRQSFGGRLQFFIGGGALLDLEMQRYFYAIGIPIYQGYGLTEAAPVISANVPAAHKLGTSGKLVPDLQLRIVDDDGRDLPPGEKGEIVVKGENVMKGYWKNKKATAETIRGGWLFTGDLGYIDEDGFLVVLGRKKSLLISDDGEKYSPEGIEETLVSNSPYIEQVMLYNNQSPYTVALVYPNRENLLRYLEQKRLSPRSPEGQRAALELLQREIEEYRSGRFKGMFPSKWLPSAIAVLGEGFTEQNRMLNSTLKMVRGRIVEFYKDRIDHLYTPEGKDIFNHRNMTIISRLAD
jgi:long-chain acyl-CoA synthetase